MAKRNFFDHGAIEKKLPRTDLTSRRNTTRSRSRGAIMRGKQDRYDHGRIEKFWQSRWKKEKTNYPIRMTPAKNKFYNLWMFPYPSAEGLHVGTAFAATGSDVIGRFERMNGKEVFQPIGYDSFGIHSENYAIKIKQTPQKMLARTMKNYERQLRSLGYGYDWTRTVTTSDIDYYKWTQWLFVELFKAGLAYRKAANVNWCPSCKTVLADEQVINGECERCGHRVEIKELKQWFFRITDYADRLLENLEKIDWPQKIKTAQTNWIGKKKGIDIIYEIEDREDKVICWTSRPDTNFGATFVVLAPEHPLALKIATKEYHQKVSNYIERSNKKSKEESVNDGVKKTGTFTGSYAINNLNGYRMPIWVADFVISGVGTGAVVGVPGHDRRDFEFAKKHGLEVKRVVVGGDKDKSEIKKVSQVQEDEGTMINSKFLDGLDVQRATKKAMNYLEKKGWGKRKTTYHIRDWLISRQRYWGPPIPMIYCKSCARTDKSWFTFKDGVFKGGIKLLHKDQSDWPASNASRSDSGWEHAGWYPEEKLPVELPHLKNYKPKGTGRGPLADHPEFYKVTCPECGKPARRETDVSDTFLDSSWYFLAYPIQGTDYWNKGPSTGSGQDVIDNKIIESWLPVDLYFGGAEHSVLHLMYARFVTNVLYDLKQIKFEEPFPKFFAHGLMIKDGAKMSKSRGNVVNPDEYIEKFGADTLRLYIMFLGPMDGSPDFRDTGIEGMKRFVDRIWNLCVNFNDVVLVEKNDAAQVLSMMHLTTKKVTDDIQKYHYNTAISSIMEFVNLLRDKAKKETRDTRHVKRKRNTSHGSRVSYHVCCAEWDEALRTLVQLLAPFAPHMTEELWQNVLSSSSSASKTGSSSKFESVHKSAWPKFDPKLIKQDFVIIPVQVNGKLRSALTVDRSQSTDKKKVIELAKKDQKVKKWIPTTASGRAKIKKEIFIPGKLVNFVV